MTRLIGILTGFNKTYNPLINRDIILHVKILILVHIKRVWSMYFTRRDRTGIRSRFGRISRRILR